MCTKSKSIATSQAQSNCVGSHQGRPLTRCRKTYDETAAVTAPGCSRSATARINHAWSQARRCPSRSDRVSVESGQAQMAFGGCDSTRSFAPLAWQRPLVARRPNKFSSTQTHCAAGIRRMASIAHRAFITAARCRPCAWRGTTVRAWFPCRCTPRWQNFPMSWHRSCSVIAELNAERAAIIQK